MYPHFFSFEGINMYHMRENGEIGVFLCNLIHLCLQLTQGLHFYVVTAFYNKT